MSIILRRKISTNFFSSSAANLWLAMYASYRCNGLSIPRLIYRAIGRFIFPPEIYRVGKKKTNSPKRYSDWCIIIVEGDGRDLGIGVVPTDSQSCPLVRCKDIFHNFQKEFNRKDCFKEMFDQSLHTWTSFERSIGFESVEKKNLWRSVAIWKDV